MIPPLPSTEIPSPATPGDGCIGTAGRMRTPSSGRSPVRRPLRRVRALLMGVVVAAPLLTGGGAVAGAGPCSVMFGNFGSLRDQLTGAGMPTGSSGSTGSTGSAGSSAPGGSVGPASTDPQGPLVPALETGSLGEALSGSLRTVTGPFYGMPPWATGEQGTVPVLRGPTRFLQLVTGPTSPADTPARYGVGGTDLGIMWDNGDTRDPEILMAFGDTQGDCSLPGTQWRSNVLFRSADRDLADGLRIDSAPMDSDGLAASIVPRSGLPGEVTIIPTAGIAVNGVQYLRFMSVAKWGDPGSWDTNYSGLAYSVDNGETWRVVPRMARPITDTVPTGEGAPPLDSRWHRAQMSAFLVADGYLYEYLTASGRQGTPILARVPITGSPDAAALASGVPDDAGGVLDPRSYEYYADGRWVSDIAQARAVMPGPASEMSVMWNDYLGAYVAMYSSGLSPVIIRTAARPEGPGSDPTVLINYSTLPGTYGGFIHPWSSGEYLYYVVTTWNAYNVFLVRTDLSELTMGRMRRAGQPVEPSTEVVRQIPVSELDGNRVPRS